MANPLVGTLGKELEAVDHEYASDFAGHSRLTRDIAQIDRMIARTAAVLAQVDKIPSSAQGPELARVREAAAASHSLYKSERAAIERAQTVGPAFDLFAVEATNANFVFARYMRHFAGKNRSTRDVALLGELVEDLRQIDTRMTQLLESSSQSAADFASDRAVVRENFTRYQSEIKLIEAEQASGTPEDQAGLFASLANGQFSVYQEHFAGESRVSRRPALLVRVIATLKKIRDRMAELRDGGLAAEFNDKNLAIVEERLAVYENELTEIRKVRQSTPMTEIMGELGSAANRLFDEYRTNFADKPRSQADVARLAKICDKLFEIRRQMADMSLAEDSEMNHNNLAVVTEQLGMFEGEFEAVLRAQSSAVASSSAVAPSGVGH